MCDADSAPPSSAAASSNDKGAEADEPELPRGTEIVDLALDVYATAFTLANNATPGLYSSNPFRNPSMWMCWFYLLFIACSQTFVLASMLFITPTAVDSDIYYVDCERRTPDAVFAGPSPRLTVKACRALIVAFELPADADSPPHVLRRFEEPSYYFANS